METQIVVTKTKTVQQLTDNLCNKSIDGLDYNGQAEWLSDMGSHLQGWEVVVDLSIMSQCKILYTVYKHWTNESLMKEVTSRWGYDFYKWAKAHTKQRSLEPSQNTIENKITVYRDYIAEGKVEKPGIVFIPKRDDKGKIIDDSNDEGWIELRDKEIDFGMCDYSKLLVARGTARKNDMTPEAWTSLFDPYETVEDLKHKLDGIRNGDSTHDKSDNFHLFERDGIIYASKNGETCPICVILFDEKENPLWYMGLDQLLSSVKVKIPLEYKENHV